MTDQKTSQIDLTKAMTDELVAYQNVRQELVITTVDKLKLCLIEHKDHLRARREWLAPAGLLVSLVTTLVAADFHDALGLPKASWIAIYVLAAFASAIATVVLVIKALATLRKSSLDQLIDKIAARSPSASSGAAAVAYPEAFAEVLRELLGQHSPRPK